MEKSVQKWVEAERLRRAAERQAQETAVSNRLAVSHADGRALGRAEGRREAGASMAQVPPQLIEHVMDHAAREFGRELARNLDAKIPGQIVMEVAAEVWSMLQTGDLRALGHDTKAYVNFRVDERGDLVLDARLPEMHWRYGIPREDVIHRRDRFYG